LADLLTSTVTASNCHYKMNLYCKPHPLFGVNVSTAKYISFVSSPLQG
jgi:hypothetical protein